MTNIVSFVYNYLPNIKQEKLFNKKIEKNEEEIKILKEHFETINSKFISKETKIKELKIKIDDIITKNEQEIKTIKNEINNKNEEIKAINLELNFEKIKTQKLEIQIKNIEMKNKQTIKSNNIKINKKLQNLGTNIIDLEIKLTNILNNNVKKIEKKMIENFDCLQENCKKTENECNKVIEYQRDKIYCQMDQTYDRYISYSDQILDDAKKEYIFITKQQKNMHHYYENSFKKIIQKLYQLEQEKMNSKKEKK